MLRIGTKEHNDDIHTDVNKSLSLSPAHHLITTRHFDIQPTNDLQYAQTLQKQCSLSTDSRS
jgi:hypothetical protein